jgi:hypothetical protein
MTAAEKPHVWTQMRENAAPAVRLSIGEGITAIRKAAEIQHAAANAARI